MSAERNILRCHKRVLPSNGQPEADVEEPEWRGKARSEVDFPLSAHSDNMQDVEALGHVIRIVHCNVTSSVNIRMRSERKKRMEEFGQ